MMDAFIHGLSRMPSRGKAAGFLLLTLVYWGLNALGMSVLGRGFGFELGGVESCALLGVLVVGIMIPAGPGMVGTFQGAIVVGLALFAPREAVATRGTAFANVVWAVQLYVVVIGSVGVFSLLLFVLRRWTASATSYQTVLSPPVTILLAAAGAVACLVAMLQARLRHHDNPRGL